jgi:Transaldolase/Fructose-6-phosphate aldolase
MKATQKLYDLGQSLWLDNITRNLLNSGLLQSYINELSVTGLTSNPTIFDHAIKNNTDYDAAIRNKLKEGKAGEGLFFELALEDLTRAADFPFDLSLRRRHGRQSKPAINLRTKLYQIHLNEQSALKKGTLIR